MLFLIVTALLLAPPLVIVGFWWASVRRQRQHLSARLPDAEAVVMTRLGGIACTLLPLVQVLASIVRYRSGGFGTFLWYVVPGFGILLAVVTLASFLSNAHGRERVISSAMVVLSTSMLLLLTLAGSLTNA